MTQVIFVIYLHGLPFYYIIVSVSQFYLNRKLAVGRRKGKKLTCLKNDSDKWPRMGE